MYPITIMSVLLLVEESCRMCHALSLQSTRPVVNEGL